MSFRWMRRPNRYSIPWIDGELPTAELGGGTRRKTTMKFVTLSMIVKENVTRPQANQPNGPTGEDDGLEDHVVETNVAPVYEITETQPVTIGADSIRNFYPRKHQAPGTRIVLKSGVAYVVKELHDEVLAKINSLG